MDDSSRSSILPEVSVLIHFKKHAKKVTFLKGSGTIDLVERCGELFPEADSYFLQVHDDEFDQWVDLGDTFTVDKKTIIKMIEDKNEARPTKRPAGSSSDDERGKSLLQTIQSIKKKLKPKKSSPKKNRKEKLKSSEITFQIGWLHFNSKRREYVQVRAIKGGGSPTLREKREATKEEVIMLGKNTFFPNGHSKLGAFKDMTTHLADFRANPITEEEWTLESIAVTGVKIRLYLCTKLKVQSYSDLSSDTGSDLPDPGLSAGPSATSFSAYDDQVSSPEVSDTATLAFRTSATTATDYEVLASALEAQASASEVQASTITAPPYEVQSSTITPPPYKVQASAKSEAFEVLASVITPKVSATSAEAVGVQASAHEVQVPLTGAVLSTCKAGTSTSPLGTASPFHPAGTPTVLFKTSLKGTCGICCDREKDSFFVPCGHTICLPCATYFEESTKKECPFCKQFISAVRSLYI